MNQNTLAYNENGLENGQMDFLPNFSYGPSNLHKHYNALQEVLDQYSDINHHEIVKCIMLLMGITVQVKVYGRIRPQLAHDVHGTSAHAVDGKTVLVEQLDTSGGECIKTLFEFDKLYPPTMTTSDIAEDVKEYAEDVMYGQDVSIYTYGPRSSGKNETMRGFGSKYTKDGLVARVFADIFRIAEECVDQYQYDIELSIFIVHDNQIEDLIEHDKRKKYKLSRSVGNNGPSIPNLQARKVININEVWELIELAERNLKRSWNKSHTIIFFANIKRVNLLTSEDDFIRPSRLYLVELIGSERKTQRICRDRSKVLVHFESVIHAIQSWKTHHVSRSSWKIFVPFRNSKFTYLLSKSYDAHCKILVIVHLEPEQFKARESIDSLNFAKKIMSPTFAEVGKQAKKKKNPRDRRKGPIRRKNVRKSSVHRRALCDK